MIWVWIAGGVALVAVAVLPPLLARRTAARREFTAARDRAHSAMSRLAVALDTHGGKDGADAAGEARRCAMLAESALAGQDTTEAFRQAESWARQGLQALGLDQP